jgi:hypothetical protein
VALRLPTSYSIEVRDTIVYRLDTGRAMAPTTRRIALRIVRELNAVEGATVWATRLA